VKPRLFHPLLLALSVVAAGAAPSPDLENSDARFEITDMHGKPAPEWRLTDWKNSRPLTLAGLRGKIVVLEFWSPWCRQCVATIPKKNALQKKYRDRGVVFIGVCAGEGAAEYARVVQSKGIRYPVALDADELTRRRYRANSTPDTYVIDRQGRLRWGDIVGRHVEKAIEILLAETND